MYLAGAVLAFAVIATTAVVLSSRSGSSSGVLDALTGGGFAEEEARALKFLQDNQYLDVTAGFHERPVKIKVEKWGPHLRIPKAEQTRMGQTQVWHHLVAVTNDDKTPPTAVLRCVFRRVYADGQSKKYDLTFFICTDKMAPMMGDLNTDGDDWLKVSGSKANYGEPWEKGVFNPLLSRPVRVY